MSSLQELYFPETAVGGFSRVDGSVEFWGRIAALIRPGWHALDFGAGRGAHIAEDCCAYRRGLKTLKGRVSHVEGCDVDPAVRDNPYLDHATVIDPSLPLPYADGSFDLVVANWVLEHVGEPERVSAELARVTKPNGWIVGATANRWGYVALASSMIANHAHSKLLKTIQPDRLERDVFPTHYRMNTRRALRRLFGRFGKVYAYTNSAEPAYHFNSRLAYRFAMGLHKILPAGLQTGLFVFVNKNPAEG